MTMEARDLSVMPADIAALGQRLFPATQRYRLIGDQLAGLLADADFADLYEPTGRRALPPSLLALVTLFQFVENVPDREAAELVVARLDWKYALHLPLDADGFDFSVLCYFRQRLVEHGALRRVFDGVLNKLKALGYVKGRGRQRTDSTAVLGAVKALSELETVSETLRLAVRTLERQAPDWTQRNLPPEFVEKWGYTKPDYRLGKAAREAEFLSTGVAGKWLQDRLANEAALGPVTEDEALTTLGLVWDQRFAVGENGGVTARPDLPPCTDRIVTPHDVGVRAGEKRGQPWHGSKVQVTETVGEAEGAPRFITDIVTVNAASGDGEALAGIRERLAERGVLPGEQVVDSSYVSGKQLAESEAAGVTLIGPALPDTSPNEFKIADFAIDREAKQAVCPGGQTSTKWGVGQGRDGSEVIHIQFAAKVCGGCPLRERCTKGKSGRSLSLSAHYERVAARRAEAQTAAFAEAMRTRSGIEATLSELVRAHGLRRHRYRGDAKRALENLLKGAACNLKRLAKALAAGPAPVANGTAAA